jgi:hypothetical protein
MEGEMADEEGESLGQRVSWGNLPEVTSNERSKEVCQPRKRVKENVRFLRKDNVR